MAPMVTLWQKLQLKAAKKLFLQMQSAAPSMCRDISFRSEGEVHGVIKYFKGNILCSTLQPVPSPTPHASFRGRTGPTAFWADWPNNEDDFV
jgi:hypothetical protein